MEKTNEQHLSAETISTGPTFHFKEELKKMGAKFNGETKAWVITKKEGPHTSGNSFDWQMAEPKLSSPTDPRKEFSKCPPNSQHDELNAPNKNFKKVANPVGSVYGIFTYIWL